MNFLKLFVFIGYISSTLSRLEQGIFETQVRVSGEQFIHFHRSAFKGSTIEIKWDCKAANVKSDDSLMVDVVLRSSPCGKEFYETLDNPTNDTINFLRLYYDAKNKILDNFDYKSFWISRIDSKTVKCEEHTSLSLSLGIANPLIPVKVDGNIISSSQRKKREDAPIEKKKETDEDQAKNKSEPKKPDVGSKVDTPTNKNPSTLHTDHPLFKVDADEIYLLTIRFSNSESKSFNVSVTAEWNSPSGYLGPIDWPLLPFYGVMCGVYAIYALAWLILSSCQWRDLLRIQFWIGAVIGLGLVENMVFYMEHQTMNHTGREIEGAMEFAEIFSCLKKTLSFMLVVIVSVGFGVVKPRLGSTLHKVVGFGFVYFLLCSIEGVVRVSKVQNESVKQKRLIVLPLIFIQLGWFYWVFTSLINTMRALRLRRNEVKLSMYRHFTHTLIFSCVASLGYMLWSLFMHRTNCMKDWKELWVDTGNAFWHILFSVLLLVIMILWRPTNNNQRYAFSPLLDNEDEEDDEEDTVFSEAFTSTDAMKLKKANQSTTKAENRKNRENKEANSLEDDLKWVEQHIPSSTLADKTLPAFVDSDEEREQTRFEVSKMQ